MTPIIVIAIVLALAVIAVFMMSRAMRAAAPVPASGETPFALDEGEARLVERDPEITWPTLVAPDSKILDDEARLRLINDLGLVRAAWCAPILQRAYEEERLPANRDAALHALAACDGGAELPAAESSTSQ